MASRQRDSLPGTQAGASPAPRRGSEEGRGSDDAEDRSPGRQGSREGALTGGAVVVKPPEAPALPPPTFEQAVLRASLRMLISLALYLTLLPVVPW